MSENAASLKNHAADRRVLVLPLLRALLGDPASLRLGISGTPENMQYVLIALHSKEGAVPVAWGTGFPLLLRLLVPAVAHADTGYMPLHLLAETTGDEDPDAWIDRNDARIIPPGFTADQIVTDAAVDGKEIIILSAVEQARDNLLAALEKKIMIATLLPPLQGLAAAYRTIKEPSWVLWKIDPQGSVFGRIECGMVKDVCHFWAGTEAIDTDPSAVNDGVAPLLRSVAGKAEPLKVMYWRSDSPPPATGLPQIPGCQYIDAPEISGLPQRFHEAYGNALCSVRTADLLPFHKKQTADTLLRTWRKTIFALRFTAIILAALAAIAGSYIGVSRLLVVRDRTAMHDIDARYNAVQEATSLRDSLQKVFGERADIIGNESAITLLLSDLQEAFPEGVQAEEMTVVERDNSSWRLTIRAFAQSSGLLQPFVNNLQGLKSMHEVRTVYSEQVNEKKIKQGIRFKIEAVWR